jgi:hypothetical protein
MRTEHVEDSIGSYQFGERNYEGVTHQEATRLEKKHLEQLAKKNKKKVKDEDAGKAVASVKDAGKAEVSVTEAGRPEESATEAEEALKKQAEEGALLNSTGSEPLMHKQTEEEQGKRPERQLYAEIQRALLDIQEKLAKKNWKTDKRTLQLLKDMSNKLDMLDQGSGDDETYEIDQTCLDTNEAFFKPGKLFLDPLAKEMADEEESFASYSRLWEYKWGKTRGFFRDPSEQHTNPLYFVKLVVNYVLFICV